ncbi:unnamed protein product [Auanema sp. JU1783]|nr:unnamed protein product [Auanema sp. JU1783]
MPKDQEAKASPIGNFLSKFGRVRARSPRKPSFKNSTDKENDVVFKCPAPPRSHSPSSKFGTLVNRLSGRKPKTISCRESSLDRAETPKNPQHQHVPFQSPRPAVSENDLRHVTLSRGGADLPVTPLAGVTHFMSEDNLASAECGTPAHRVPSYVKISCTLNGYSKSPRQQTQISDSPLRSTKGMSLVERRLMQYRDFSNSACNTPSPKRLPIYNDETSPEMGNNISSTTPIKSLISQFDKLHLCSHDKDTEKTNEFKSEKIISVQPESEEAMSDKENFSNLSKYIGESIPSTSSSELCSEESSPRVSSGSGEVKEKVVTEGDDKVISSARSGKAFQDVLNETKTSLERKICEGDENLEKIQDLSDEASSHIRMACGKAKLLIKKKLSKFSELVNKNLNPIEGDLQPATDDDLEGYWALVEIELEDIKQCFNIVEKWRMNNWSEPQGESDNLSDNNNVVKPKAQVIKVKPAPQQAKPKTEKQIAMEQQRKKQMAEARARMAAARKAQTDDSDCNVIIAS